MTKSLSDQKVDLLFNAGFTYDPIQESYKYKYIAKKEFAAPNNPGIMLADTHPAYIVIAKHRLKNDTTPLAEFRKTIHNLINSLHN